MLLLCALACTATPDGGTSELVSSWELHDTAYVDVTAPYVPREASGGNILMISIDTLRVSNLAQFGGQADTPNLSRLLLEGRNFTNHRSCSSWTFPGAACTLTGVDLVDAGWFPQSSVSDDTIPAGLKPLAEKLQKRGYATGLVTSNRVLSRDHGFARGLDEFWAGNFVSSKSVVQEGLAMLPELRRLSSAWFLHLHFSDPHLPHEPPPRFLSGLDELEAVSWDLTTRTGLGNVEDAWPDLSTDERDLILEHLRVYYDAELAYMDEQIGEFLDELGDELDETNVVFWSDHGEQYYEHGSSTHHRSIYAEETLALGGGWGPDIVKATVREPTRPVDVFRLVMALAGQHNVGDDSDERFSDVVLKTGDLVQSVERDGLRLIRDTEQDTLELYDLESDPTEQHDLAAERPEDVEALWEVLEPRVEALRALYPEADTGS